ncbi:uncharacterized protein LOC130893037 [Diorhabda carinulata]|uniref:uncharacterized protein LOC130893037 n=1 Tax=Diorhabda carinulata TaxID=1163345 RepID=UPI0025A1D11E|nr:uncharacterized protein LOC130893037 [Diorhabda carinulata]
MINKSLDKNHWKYKHGQQNPSQSERSANEANSSTQRDSPGNHLKLLAFQYNYERNNQKSKKSKGLQDGDRNITILCYADDAVLVAKNEDDLQRLLHVFNCTAKSFNKILSTSNTKCITTSKTPIRCKLVIDDQIIHQVMEFKCLGIEISGFEHIENEVREQTTKALRIAACLNETIWQNKHIGIQAKSRLYKVTVKPIMTYTAETHPETAKTKRMMEIAEMKVLRRIAGKTLLDRESSENIRRLCKMGSIKKERMERAPKSYG